MQNPSGSAPISDELQRVYEEVTEQFLERCSRQIELLEAFASGVDKVGRDMNPQGVHDEAHRISGIARSLGFARLGDAASELEECTSAESWAPEAFVLEVVLKASEDLLEEMLAAINARKSL